MKLRFALTTLISICVSIVCFTQSPYHVSWKNEIGYYALGISTVGLSSYMETQVNALTTEEILELDRNDVNSFDRFATRNSSSKAKVASDIFFYSSVALPITSIIMNRKYLNHCSDISILYGEVFLINLGLTTVAKRAFLRSRPLAYNEDFDLSDKNVRNARYSFFSGHASLVTSNSFFGAKVFSDFFPDSKLKPVVWGIAITAPAITSYLRVRAGKHFPTDVMTGYAVGALVGVLVPVLHKRKKKKKNIDLSLLPTGAYLSWRL